MAKEALIDNWGRPINYLRLAVTDRCNLRCFYCMPAEGINYLPRKELLTYEELLQLVTIFSQLGVNKVRITGGEPLVRRDVIPFMKNLSDINGIDAINLTTNGLLTHKYINDLKAIGINTINLSLDTLDKDRFTKITRKDTFNKVYDTLWSLIDEGFKVKINMVVMQQHNIDDIVPMAALTENHDISVRFIEEMPFNGTDNAATNLKWNAPAILNHLQSHFTVNKITDPKHSTAQHYKINDYKGDIGIIAAYTRTFCGSCNRIRLTAQGEMRTCLYANNGLDLKTLLRQGACVDTIKTAIRQTINHRYKDGFEAERHRKDTNNWESMSTIGG